MIHRYGYHKLETGEGELSKVAKDSNVNISIGGGEKKAPTSENAVTKGLQAGAAAAGAATAARGVISDTEGGSVVGNAARLAKSKVKSLKHAKDAKKAGNDAKDLKGKWFKWGAKRKAQSNLKYSAGRAKHYAREGSDLAKRISGTARGKLAGPASLAAGLAAASHYTSNKDERAEVKKTVKKDK